MPENSSYQRIQRHSNFSIPAHWRCIRTIDMHTGGEPLRVIVDGFPELEGTHVLEYRRFVKTHYDHLRTALLHEPRGHADMYGCLIVPPNDPGAHFGVLFIHNEGYSTMCGHAVIALARLAVELKWVDVETPKTNIRIDAPCGRIDAWAHLKNSQIIGCGFAGVPSFCLALDQEVNVPGLGPVRYDLSYGGAFYAYVDARPLGLELSPANYFRLIETGMAIKKAVIAADARVRHPFEPDLSFLYGTIFIGDAETEGVDSRNVCVFADGEVDRSPTGSGVMGRLAIHHARGELSPGEVMTVESITGSVFSGEVLSQTSYGPYQAIIPKVEGTAFITGQHEFLIDPDDPFANGFFLR